MKPILFALFYENTADNNEQSNPYLALSRQLFESGAFEEGGADIRRFPDGESYVRVLSECGNREVLILANLHHPDDKLLPLLFFCQTLKDQSAAKVTLIAPYLPYMRQDKRFHEGECITSATFASLISPAIDQLITIDPHLHRYHSLSEIYSTEHKTLQADKVIAKWIKRNIEQPLIIGPDSESEQWAAATADLIHCPHLVLQKERLGDREVNISAPGGGELLNRTPVLVDDIISTGRTMIETAKRLTSEGFKRPICIGVHGVFSESDYHALKDSGVTQVITCNTIPHCSNEIDVSGLLVDALKLTK